MKMSDKVQTVLIYIFASFWLVFAGLCLSEYLRGYMPPVCEPIHCSVSLDEFNHLPHGHGVTYDITDMPGTSVNIQ
jgi:hypothetical protein